MLLKSSLRPVTLHFTMKFKKKLSRFLLFFICIKETNLGKQIIITAFQSFFIVCFLFIIVAGRNFLLPHFLGSNLILSIYQCQDSRTNTFKFLCSLHWGIRMMPTSLVRIQYHVKYFSQCPAHTEPVRVFLSSCLENKGVDWEKKPEKLSICSRLYTLFLVECSPAWLAISGICLLVQPLLPPGKHIPVLPQLSQSLLPQVSLPCHYFCDFHPSSFLPFCSLNKCP